MIGKILLWGGLIFVAISLLNAVRVIIGSFQAMENAAFTGLDPVIAGINEAIYSGIAAGIGSLIFVIGLIKIIRDRKKEAEKQIVPTESA